MKKLSSIIKQLAPWVIAALIFVYLFHLYPADQVWRSLKLVNIPFFALFAVGYFVFIYLVDSWVLKYVISRFCQPVKFMDLLAARGATYLVMIINYPASQAALAYYLKRRYGIGIFEALSVFFFIIFIDLMWIITLAFAGSFFQDFTVAGVSLGSTVQVISLCAYAFAVLWIAFWRKWPAGISGKLSRIKFVEKLRAKNIFRIFDQARVSDYFKTAVARIPIHFSIIISMFIFLKTFNVSIPFVKVLGNMPLAFFVGTLPITPGGLGTTNAMMVELLAPYLKSPIFDLNIVTPQELLFAASLLWMFANYSMKAIIGTFFFKRVSSDLFKPTPEAPLEEVEHEATKLKQL